MTKRVLRTSDVAKAAGVHPNTVRLYEQWGFLPKIPRGPTGYRLFTGDHVDQMRLARTALRGPWPGRTIKHSALDLVRRSAAGDLGGALEQAYRHLALVHTPKSRFSFSNGGRRGPLWTPAKNGCASARRPACWA